jgi:PAS domain S-box-containing protein
MTPEKNTDNQRRSYKQQDTAEIRRHAEAEHSQRYAEDGSAQPVVDQQRLVHELQVHQIELELQNEELMQVRAELEMALDQYTDLYDFAPVGYFTLGRDGTILQVNLSGASLLEVGRAQLIDQRLALFVANQDRSNFSAFLARTFDSQTKETCEVALRKKEPGRAAPHPDRSVELFSEHLARETDQRLVRAEAVAADDRQTCRAILLDITEQRQAEAALVRNEERYRLLYERSPLGYQSLDADGKFIEVNQAWLDTLGYSREEVLGHWFGEFLVPEMVEAFRQRFPRFKAKGEVHNQFQMVHKDGRIITVAFDGKIGYDQKGQFKQTHCVLRDITEQQKMEESLRESEKKFRIAQDMSPDGFTILRPVRDAQGRIVDFIWIYENAAVARLNGTDPEAIVGQRLLDRFPGHRDTPILRAYQQVAEIGETCIFEADYSGESMPEPISLRIVVVPMGDDIAILAQDITERKQAELEILANNERLSALTEILQHPSKDTQEFLDYALEQSLHFTKSKFGYIYFYDEEKQEFTLNSWSREVLEACSIQSPQTVYELERTGIWGEAVRQCKPIVVNDFAASHPLKQGYPEGHAPLKNFMTVPVLNGQKIVAVVGVANKLSDYSETDVLQLTLLMQSVWQVIEQRKAEEASRESEKKYRKLHEAMIDGFIFVDMQGRIREFNRSFQDMLGYDSEELARMTFLDLTPEKWYASEQKIINEQILPRGYSDIYQKEYRKKDGTVFAVELRTFLIKDDAGENQGMWAIVRDVTERVQMAKALEEERNLLAQRVQERTAELSHANAELMNALQTKDEFLANMSHELRTPLTSILGVSEILSLGLRGELNQKQIDSIQIIYQSGEHLLALINDILDFSRIEAGKLEIDPGMVNLEDICQGSLSLIKGMAHGKNLSVSCHLSDPQLEVRADGRRLKQILVNLLSNAVKFTPEGGQVSLEAGLDSKQQRVRFMVQDNGIGISKEGLEKLFQPFTQLDSGLSRQYEGSGLGLALVRKLVKLHHGEVFAESEGIPGRGSRFTVLLPWESNQDLEAALPAGAIKPVSPEMGDMSEASNAVPEKQAVILVAEDNLSNMATLSEYLQISGYAVLHARDGKEAIEIAATSSPDLILMDIQMPVMDGLEAIRCLRKDPRFMKTPILALTALAMPGDLERCFEAGANGYLSKPIGMKDLLQKVRASLEAAE